MKTYTPAPIDTKAVCLPDEILQLSEKLAKNAHEVWSTGRIAQGWTYGPVRDDVQKTHPCLVPYEDLPEQEKDYDRNTSMETLKLILRLGYTITKA